MTYRWVLCYILYHGTEVGVHSCSLQQLNSPFYSSCLAWSIAATITERNRPLPIPYPLAKFDKTPIRAGPLAFGLCGGETSWRILQFTLVFVWNSASLEFYSIKNQAILWNIPQIAQNICQTSYLLYYVKVEWFTTNFLPIFFSWCFL